MLTMFILGLSILLQIIASVLALRLIPLTRGWKAWVLIAAALLLIVVRRAIHMGAILTGLEDVGPSDPIEGSINLALSALLVAGVWFIRPLFVQMAHEREAFRQQMEELRTIMEVAPAAIWVAHDPQCHRITGNRTANELYRVPSETNVSVTPSAGETPPTLRFFENGRELAPEELPMQRAAVQGVAIREVEMEVVLADGTRQVVMGNALPLRNVGGEVRGVVAAFLNITDRLRAQDALRKAKDELEQRVEERTAELSQSRARLTTLFRTSPVGIFLTQLEDGRFVEVNDAYLQIIGYSAEEMAGSTSLDLNLFADPDERKRLIGLLRTTGRIVNAELHYRHKSGKILTLLVNALPLNVDEVPCILGTLLDITDRKQAEEALRKSEQAERDFSQRLVALHEVMTELSQSHSLDDLCRQAVELGRSRLRFDRLGLWFIDELPYAVGTYGTDEAGNLRDERNVRVRLGDEDIFAEVMRGGKPVVLRSDAPLTDGQHHVVGRGQHATASLWDGKKIIGCLSADNLLLGQPISEGDCRILMLYAASLGHLCSRMRADRERQQAVARLKDLEAIVNRSGAVAFLWDAGEHWPVKYVSGNVSQFGYTADELLSRQYCWTDIVVREDQPRLTQEVLAAFACGTNELVQQYRIRTKSGDIRWVEDHTRLIGLDGRISQAEGVLLDITDRKQASDRLRESEERYRTILETAMDGFWLADTQGRLLEVNGAYCRMSGYSRQELLAMRIADLEANKTAEELVAHIQKVMSQGWDRFESRHRRKDGSVFDVEVSILYRSGNGGQGVIFLRDITERKRADDVLKESEERYRTLVTNIPGAVFRGVAGTPWRFEFLSDGVQALTGHPASRFLGPEAVSFNSLVLPEDLPAMDAAMKVVEQHMPYVAEYRIRCADGAVRWLAERGQGSFDEQGQLQSLEGVLLDITDKKQAEEALRESQHRMRTILDTIPDTVWMKDLDGRFLAVNAAWCRGVGATPEQALGKTVFDFHPENQAREYAERDLEVTRSGEQVVYEQRHTGKDGLPRYAETIKRPLVDSDGKIIGSVGISHDITDRKMAAAEMARLAQQRQIALDAARLGWWHYDPITRVMLGDARYKEIFALTDSQRLNDETLGRLYPEDLPRIRVALEAALDPVDPKPYSVEHRIRHPDGTVRWVEAHGTTAFEGEETARRATGIIGTVADITDRKMAEEELRSAHASLQTNAAQLRVLAHELTRVEQRERRRMAALLHDHLQQLMVAAKLNVASLTKGSLEADQQESARKAIAALDEAVSQSRSLAVELSPPVLREGGLGHALQWLGRRMHDLQGLTVHVEAGDGDGRIDEDLRIVLFNAVRELLFNVVKHANVKAARVEMRILTDNQVQIAVDDEGVGFVPAEAVSNARTQGGLGLFAIRERLESLGGRLDIDSGPRGSRIILTSPIRSSGPATGQNHPMPATKGIPKVASVGRDSQSPIRVLLVDDHVMIRQGISQLLSQAPDIEVVAEASDGEEAVRLAQDIRPDVVVMDVNMPKMNGIEATRAIRAQAPGIAVIGLSMYEEAHRAEEMRQAGATAYIAKNEVAEALVAAIYACCRR